MQTFAELNAIPIFATGEWKGEKFVEADLDEMAANFEKSSAHIKPPVKLGHDDKQILAQKDGQPALGWVNRIYRQGKKLLADISQVPDVLVQAVRDGRYRTVSAELYRHFEDTNAEKNLKTGLKGHVLSAIAFLGADLPEVKTLEDLQAVLASDTGEAFVFSDAPAGEAFSAVADIYQGYGDPTCHLCKALTPSPTESLLFEDGVLTFIIRKEGDEWVLYDHNGEKVLGRHKTRESALAQERAIEIAKHQHTESLPIHADSHAEDMATERPEPKPMEKDMTDEEIKALQDKLAAAEQRMAETEVKIQASEAKITALEKEAQDEKTRREVIEKENRRMQAAAFVEQYQKPECLKIYTQEQAEIMKALYCWEPNGNPVLTASEAAEKKLFSEGEKPCDLSFQDMLKKFIDAQPDQKVLLTAVTKDVPKPAADETLVDAITAVIAREKLDPVKDYDKAVQLAAKEKPHLYNYGRPGA